MAAMVDQWPSATRPLAYLIRARLDRHQVTEALAFYPTSVAYAVTGRLLLRAYGAQNREANMQQYKADVVVIGAGIAGLSATLEL